MAESKVRKEKLSIYLARDASKEDIDLIKTENANNPIVLDIAGVEKAILYVKKETSKIPPWTKLFTLNGNVKEESFGFSSSVGAVFIVRAHNNAFILSFGTGFHLLKTDAVERDFGLRVTLNSVDPDKLRSLDKASYDLNPLNSRNQSSKEVDIFNLHVDFEMEMLYAITGTSKVELFGSNVTGRDALTIAVEVTLDKIVDILKEAIDRYRLKLPKQFDWVENINRVRDLSEIEILDYELETQFQNNQYQDFWLGEPEIVDWESQIGYSFDLYSNTPRHVTLNIDDYLNYIRPAQVTVNTLKINSVHVNNNEYKAIKSWSVYRCLYAEIKYANSQYVLRNGIWYKINQDFVSSVDEYLQDVDIHPYKFPLYDHDREEYYNKHIADTDSCFTLMDKRNIKIGGPYDKLEHCDLIKDGCEFIHVKYYSSSATLSHLFSQGFVAAEAFVKDAWYRERLNTKLPDCIKLQDAKLRPNPGDYKIVYAIATKKTLPLQLPFFSKVTLKNSLKTLKALNYGVELAQIDVSQSILVKKKYKLRKSKR